MTSAPGEYSFLSDRTLVTSSTVSLGIGSGSGRRTSGREEKGAANEFKKSLKRSGL